MMYNVRGSNDAHSMYALILVMITFNILSDLSYELYRFIYLSAQIMLEGVNGCKVFLFNATHIQSFNSEPRVTAIQGLCRMNLTCII